MSTGAARDSSRCLGGAVTPSSMHNCKCTCAVRCHHAAALVRGLCAMVDPKPVPLDFDQRHTEWIFQLRIYSHSIVHAHRHGGIPPCTHRAEPRRRVKWRAAGKREVGICGWNAHHWFGFERVGLCRDRHGDQPITAWLCVGRNHDWLRGFADHLPALQPDLAAALQAA